MKTYAIHWKSTATGRIGTGSKLFEKEEAEQLAVELNGEHPEFEHEAVIPPIRSADSADVNMGLCSSLSDE